MAFGDFVNDLNKQREQTAPAAPSDSGPGTGQGTVPTPSGPQSADRRADSATPDASSGGGWGDWGALYGNEWAMHSIPALRMQADEARKRLGPAASASAEFLGSATSPSQALQAASIFAPGSGGPLSGGVHEGVKSYMDQPDWIPQGKNLERVVGDASYGTLEGALGGLLGSASKYAVPAATRAAVQLGPPAALQSILHYTIGHGNLYPELMSGATNLGIIGMLNKTGEGAYNAAKGIAGSPAAQQAIRSLIMGGGSALRGAAGPYDQWGASGMGN